MVDGGLQDRGAFGTVSARIDVTHHIHPAPSGVLFAYGWHAPTTRSQAKSRSRMVMAGMCFPACLKYA